MFYAILLDDRPCVVIGFTVVRVANYLAEAQELAEELNVVAGFVHEE